MLASTLYKSIYSFLGDTTPLRVDCGKLCNKACCSEETSAGDEMEEAGMYLFPGEKNLFINHPNYRVLPSDFIYGKKHADIVICNGPCERETRPLSCRIFPLVPYFREETGLKIIQDPRAYVMCPLSTKDAYPYLDPKFIKKTTSVFRLLTQFSEVRQFLVGLADILDDYLKFEQEGSKYR